MMTDVYGVKHPTVGDFAVHPEWVEYSIQFKKWLKSMTVEDWIARGLQEKIRKYTPKDQAVFQFYTDKDKPKEPTVCMSQLITS